MIIAVYFSPAGSTRKVVEMVAKRLSERLSIPYRMQSYTLPEEREAWQSMSADDIVVWGTPVYAGRIPNKTLDFVKTHITAVGAKGICVATFGNRHFDNALAEMSAVMQAGGIRTVAAAAVVARHVFSPELIAPGRPNADDCEAVAHWCDAIDLNSSNELLLPGSADLPYYTPKGAQGQPAKFLKALPVVDEARCNGCGLCAHCCPVGSITLHEGKTAIAGLCIKCQACVLGCPCHAIAITDPDFLSHKLMLEQNFSTPAQCRFFNC